MRPTPSAMASETWIPDIGLFFTCRYTREYLACNHTARHEFLARNATEWPDLAKELFFVQADECQASCDEFLGDEGEDFEDSSQYGEEEEVISYGRYDHQVQIVSGGVYEEEEDVVIREDSEGEDSEEVDDETNFDGSIEQKDIAASVEHDDSGYHEDEAPQPAECNQEKKQEEGTEWAEVKAEIDDYFQDW